VDLSRLLDPANYVYNAYALPQLACALMTFLLGVTVFARERDSRVGGLYVFQTIAIGTWMLGFGVANLAADVDVAQHWLRFGHVGVCLIPALTLHFTWAVVRPTARAGWVLWLAWVGAWVFVVLTLAAPWFFDAPYRYPWGYYLHSNVYSNTVVPFLFVLFGSSLWLYRQAYRHAHPNSVAARRAKLLYIAFVIGGLGAIDFLPAFGVDIYPIGYVPILISIGLVTYITGRHRLVDITPAFAANQILDTINDGLFVLDKDGVIQVANNALLTMIGAKHDEVIGKRIPASLRRLLTPAELMSIQAGVPMQNREVEFKRRDGAVMILNVAVSIMRERAKENVAYVCVLRDVTERKRAEERIRFLAYYDSLTGLPNRQQFEEQLRAALATAARNNRIVAVLFLDLDHFKRINDTLGHTLGDALLQAIAGRLLACVRKERTGAKGIEDTVARLGGDEFIVALYDLDEQDDALRVAERVLAVVCEPMRLDKHEIAITASVGISIYPHDGDDVGVLLKNADAAMYQAKEAGRNNYFLYDRTMNIATYDRLSLQAKLRRALERGDLTLDYQPQVATHSKETVGVEALLRWRDPVLGSIPPSRFIPIAEECGLILPMGDWVLKTACAQVRAWEDAGLPALRVAVNLSSRQFRDRDLVSFVREALSASKLEPYRLELEITESMIMQDALHTRQTLEALKRMGVRLSIDDFGTGYSSLSYLRSFPIDTLKIDRTFVNDIGATPDNGAIVAAIIAMARSLKLGVIAEGVDTEEQLAFLELHGCKLAQGFLFCKPLPASELEAWMQVRHARAAR
jgi:diguanylate cyclase (GGDEF)-like protein/PAS domain S-box-containing protein